MSELENGTCTPDTTADNGRPPPPPPEWADAIRASWGKRDLDPPPAAKSDCPDPSPGPILREDSTANAFQQVKDLARWADAAGIRVSPENRALPAITSAAEILKAPPPELPQLVHGLIHQGTKACFSGGSKSHKTWSLIDVAMSVSAGIPWCGFPTTQGRTLYVNFELHPAFMVRRVEMVAKARNCVEALPNLDLWNLRGYACSAEEILPQITEQIRDRGYALVIIDPIYKIAGGRDENSAGDITQLMNAMEQVAVETGAAVVYAAHYAKGNAASKEAIDRVSGSGVFARDPDTILPLTPHEESDAFVVEPILRNFPPQKPFALRWEHPLMRRADDLNPAELKRPMRGGRTAKHVPTLDEFMTIFPKADFSDPQEAVLTSPQIEEAFTGRGWDKKRIVPLREEAAKAGMLEINRGGHNRLSIGRPAAFASLLGSQVQSAVS